MTKKTVVIFGLGPHFKGGIANYTTSLAKTFDKIPSIETHLISWTQQYPAVIPRDFVDRSSKTDLLEGSGIKIRYITNYNNPLSWKKTVSAIAGLSPDIVIFQWSIALQGIPLGYIARKLRNYPNIEILFDLHFVLQKEGSFMDSALTRFGVSSAHGYIVHSYKTAEELKQTFPTTSFTLTETGKRAGAERKTVIKLFHPVYDMFTPDPDLDIEAQKQKLDLKKHVFLAFGFIRKYKGVHNTIQAFAKVAKKRDDVSLLIVGESLWDTLDPNKFSTRLKVGLFTILSKIFTKKGEDGLNYRPLDLIDQLNIRQHVKVVNQYVANEDVHKYLQVSDAMMLYYLTATPSGVESMAYNFHLPILATKVGHFPETIKEGHNGYLAEPDNIDSMANAMLKLIEKPVSKAHIAKRAKEFSWKKYALAILATEK